MNERERSTLRELARRQAEIAALPFNEEKRALWRAVNGLKPVRPMVTLDQLPWHEMNVDDELTLVCEDPFWRGVELSIRKILYRYKHFPADMVVENRVDLPMSIHNLDYGIHIVDETIGKGDGNDIVSHKYEDQAATLEALDAFQPDKIWVDRALDAAHLAQAEEIFDGILPVRLAGIEFHAGVWDRVAQVHPPDRIVYEVIDDPELIIAIVEKLRDLSIDTLDQCEALGLLDAAAQYVHCTGAYVDELPAPGFDPAKPRAIDCWAFGMAQILTTVSPRMHETFEIDLMRPLYERFGLMYYGCCEPLHDKIDIIRKIKNVRKISISPWADIDKSAERIGTDFVYSYKPNPAWICAGSFEADTIETHLRHVAQACRKTGTPVEFIQKDVSTLHGHLDYLTRWHDLAMEIALSAE